MNLKNGLLMSKNKGGCLMTLIEDKVLIGGIKQRILTVWTDLSNHILLIVHGGPGSPDRPLVCQYNSCLSERYNVICWDQRCSGLTYTRKRKKESLTTELMLSDLKEVVEFLLNKFGQKKLFLAGHSWGAYLGLWFASEYPQYIDYYIGTGQGISSRLDEVEKYKFVMGQATEKVQNRTVSRLLAFGKQGVELIHVITQRQAHLWEN